MARLAAGAALVLLVLAAQPPLCTAFLEGPVLIGVAGGGAFVVTLLVLLSCFCCKCCCFKPKDVYGAPGQELQLQTLEKERLRDAAMTTTADYVRVVHSHGGDPQAGPAAAKQPPQEQPSPSSPPAAPRQAENGPAAATARTNGTSPYERLPTGAQQAAAIRAPEQRQPAFSNLNERKPPSAPSSPVITTRQTRPMPFSSNASDSPSPTRPQTQYSRDLNQRPQDLRASPLRAHAGHQGRAAEEPVLPGQVAPEPSPRRSEPAVKAVSRHDASGYEMPTDEELRLAAAKHSEPPRAAPRAPVREHVSATPGGASAAQDHSYINVPKAADRRARHGLSKAAPASAANGRQPGQESEYRPTPRPPPATTSQGNSAPPRIDRSAKISVKASKMVPPEAPIYGFNTAPIPMDQNAVSRVMKWSALDVQNWLRSVTTDPSCLDALSGVAGKELVMLSKEDLEDLGVVKIGQRVKIMRALEQILGQSPADYLPPTRHAGKKAPPPMEPPPARPPKSAAPKKPAPAIDPSNEVHKFLEDLNLVVYAPLMDQEGIEELDILQRYSEQELRELGIKGGHAKKIVGRADGGLSRTGSVRSISSIKSTASTSSYSVLNGGIVRSEAAAVLGAELMNIGYADQQAQAMENANPDRLADEITLENFKANGEPWAVPRDRLEIGKLLGYGAFGDVFSGTMADDSGNKTVVAVKTLKKGPTDEDLLDFLAEIQVMQNVGSHPNVVNLLGVCIDREPMLIMVEYMKDGNLRDFLRNANNGTTAKPSSQQLVRYAVDICSGMEFLAASKCIHRDLATRNVLISGETAKIADFGLARYMDEEYQYQLTNLQRRLPTKWLAPECMLYNTFSVMTDVWAFGIVLWEIVMMGGMPYPGISARKIFTLLTEEHYRMPKPSTCSNTFYKLMRDCWHDDPDERPSFTQLRERLQPILDGAAQHINIDVTNEYAYMENERAKQGDDDDDDASSGGSSEDEDAAARAGQFSSPHANGAAGAGATGKPAYVNVTLGEHADLPPENIDDEYEQMNPAEMNLPATPRERSKSTYTVMSSLSSTSPVMPEAPAAAGAGLDSSEAYVFTDPRNTTLPRNAAMALLKEIDDIQAKEEAATAAAAVTSEPEPTLDSSSAYVFTEPRNTTLPRSGGGAESPETEATSASTERGAAPSSYEFTELSHSANGGDEGGESYAFHQPRNISTLSESESSGDEDNDAFEAQMASLSAATVVQQPSSAPRPYELTELVPEPEPEAEEAAGGASEENRDSSYVFHQPRNLTVDRFSLDSAASDTDSEAEDMALARLAADAELAELAAAQEAAASAEAARTSHGAAAAAPAISGQEALAPLPAIATTSNPAGVTAGSAYSDVIIGASPGQPYETTTLMGNPEAALVEELSEEDEEDAEADAVEFPSHDDVGLARGPSGAPPPPPGSPPPRRPAAAEQPKPFLLVQGADETYSRVDDAMAAGARAVLADYGTVEASAAPIRSTEAALRDAIARPDYDRLDEIIM